MAQWNIDTDHSSAVFSIRHMMVTNIRGHFGRISGTIHFDPANPASSSVEAYIDVSSLTTGNAKRDRHLFSADFFEVAKYPAMVFQSTRVEISGNNKGKVTGDLTIHGITRSVTLQAEHFGPVKSPADMGAETTMGFSATTDINREDFGILWNVPLGIGGFVVGKDVRVTLDIEADLAE